MRHVLLVLLFAVACTSNSDKKLEAVNELNDIYSTYNTYERIENGRKIVIKDVFSTNETKNFLWKRIKWVEDNNKPMEVFLEFVNAEFNNLMLLGSFTKQDKDGGHIFYYSRDYQNILPVLSIKIELSMPSIFDKSNFEQFVKQFLDATQEIIIPERGFIPEDALRMMLKIPDGYKITMNVITPNEMSCRIGILSNIADAPDDLTKKTYNLLNTIIISNEL